MQLLFGEKALGCELFDLFMFEFPEEEVFFDIGETLIEVI